ncbi:type II toxin-antitoxin system RelE/ParE family toxin [candidate division CSSED10-310 bacterium]|uniref:Type II toxin-antitoxin system RelE/ParE family toxin n=1 Tax=candidate division CSSED10-310 bacterium TaxID=2855610 RepID=A0ABV6YZT8_UNCC1
MEIRYEKSFERDLRKVKNKSVKNKIKEKIDEIKEVDNFASLSGIKKIRGYENYYRVRIGNFRIGIELKENIIILARILDRKDIYKYFP